MCSIAISVNKISISTKNTLLHALKIELIKIMYSLVPQFIDFYDDSGYTLCWCKTILKSAYEDV